METRGRSVNEGRVEIILKSNKKGESTTNVGG